MRILYLEDEPRDAELVEASLQAEGIVCDLTRTDTQADFIKFLHQGGFELILADYALPHFDGISALKLAHEIRPEVPFILVSGTMGEELAIEALKQGATDYVLKTGLSRIAPSVRRALREAEEHSQCKYAEEALRRSQAYLAEAQKLSHTGSFGWRVASGKIYWSEETYRIFEVEPGTQPTLDLIFERIHPEDRQSVRKIIDYATQQVKHFDFEHRLLMPDGSVKYLRVVGRPSAHTGSDDQEFVGAVTDITERWRAEQELQLLVDLVPQMILVVGTEGKWIHANRVSREYTGLTQEQYRSMDPITTVIHPDDREQMYAICKRGFSGSLPFELEARIRGKDGIYRWFLLRYNPWVEEGRVRRWYTSATEIESRKREEDRVRQENVRLEERTRIAQELHDTLLQTFLSASMMLSVAADDVSPVGSVKAQLDRILQIMNQGIQEGRNTIQDLRSTGTPDLVQALSQVQQEIAVQTDVDFRVAVVGRQEPLQPLVWHEIYRIGREALVNAFSHSHAKCVEFELEYAEKDLRMRVRDNGRGIDPQVLQSGRDGHWGLAGMRERAARIGGLLNISSSANTGTEVQLSIPGKLAFRLSSPD
ncbi:MAG TPA: PAS domain-containing protein [Terriglobales bacterium]|nr:PAS domain-containing protein [Terriglobales bacterium]